MPFDLSEAFSTAVGFLAAIVLALSAFTVSYSVAFRLTRDASTTVRWSTTAIVGTWLLIAVFHLLASFALFRLWIALLVWTVAAIVLCARQSSRRDLAEALRRDGQNFILLASEIRHSPLRWVLCAVFILLAARLFRGLIAPPLAWDALTYHLFKPARWIQAGSVHTLAMPDLMYACEFYPGTGEILWAWVMLPFHADTILALGGAIVWVLCVLAMSMVVSSFGQSRERSLIGGVVLGLTPAVFNYVTSAYVDTALLTFVLFATAFLIRFWQSGRRGDAVLACASAGLAMGVKVTALPLAAAAVLLVAVAIFRKFESPRQRTLVLLLCLGAGAIGTPDYIRAWHETGSPVYPFALKLGDRVIAPGNEEVTLLFSGKFFPALHPLRIASTLRYFFFERIEWREHLNFGLPGLIVVLVGLAGIVVSLVQRERRVPMLIMGFLSLCFVASYFSPAVNVFRSVLWAYYAGRFLLPAFALFVVAALTFDPKGSDAFWTVILAGELYDAFPRGWSLGDVHAVGWLVLFLALATGLAVLVLVHGEGVSWGRRGFLLALALCVAGGVGMLRKQARYEVYKAATEPAERRAFDVHPLNDDFASSWTIWKKLDDGVPHRISVSAGWTSLSHNWYVAPLLGSHFQNAVTYTPVTSDGSIVDYRDAGVLRAKGDRDAWVMRLIDQKIEIVVVLEPLAIEADWIQQSPGLFSMIAQSTNGHSMAYRFNVDTALLALNNGRPPRSGGPMDRGVPLKRDDEEGSAAGPTGRRDL